MDRVFVRMRVTINNDWTFATWNISDVPLTKEILDFVANAIAVTYLPVQLAPVLYKNRRLADLREPLSEYDFESGGELLIPLYFRDTLAPKYEVLHPKSRPVEEVEEEPEKSTGGDENTVKKKAHLKKDNASTENQRRKRSASHNNKENINISNT